MGVPQPFANRARRSRTVPAPQRTFNFAGALPAGAVFSRGSPAPRLNPSGTWEQVSANVPRIERGLVQVTPTTRNRVRNSAGLGTSTTATPLNWTLIPVAVGGVTITKIGEETRQGIPGSLLHISSLAAVGGTASADANHNLNFETNTGIAATTGQEVTLSMFLQMVSGDRYQMEIKMMHTERGGTTTVSVPLYGEHVRANQIGWHSWEYTLAVAGTTSDVPGLRIRTFSGQRYDHVLWVGNPQWELSAALGPPVVTSSDEATVTGPSIVPNSTHSGAAVSATLPTGHSFAVLSGLTRAVAAVGTGWVEYEITGTPSTTGSFDLVFSSTTEITAAVNDIVGLSLPIRIVSGSLANTQLTPYIVGRDAAGTVLSGQAFQGQPFPAITTDRTMSFAATLTHASTGRVTFAIRMSGTSGAPISVRFRVGTIVAGRNAAIRLNSIIPGETISISPAAATWWGGNAGTLSLDVEFGRLSQSASWTLLSLRNSTGQHGFRIRRTAASGLVLDVIGSGSVVGTQVITTERVPRGVNVRFVVTWSSAGVTVRLGKLAPATVASNPQLDASATIRLGCSPAGDEQPDAGFRQLLVWPTTLSAVEAGELVKQKHKLRGTAGWGQSLATGSNGFIYDPIAVIGFIPEEYWWPQPEGRCMMMWSPNTVPAQRSDPRGGSNRLNPSSAFDDQVILATELIYLWDQRGSQFTTGASGVTPAEVFCATTLRNAYAPRFGDDIYTLVGVGAVGGLAITQMVDPVGSALANGNVPINDQVMFFSRAKAQADIAGMDYAVDFVLMDQGEANNTTVGYYDLFIAARDQLNTRLMTATGQTTAPVWLLGQHSTFNDEQTQSVTGLLAAEKAGTANVWGPKYPYLYMKGGGYADDLLHMNATGYILSAEKASQFAKAIIDLQPRLKPLHMRSVTRIGNTLEVRYWTNPGRSVGIYDREVPDPGQMGYVVRTAGGTNVVVNAVRVKNADTIVLVCATDPGPNCSVRYAAVGYPGGVRGVLTMARGCIADDDPYVSPSDGVTPLRNWACHEIWPEVA